MNHFMLLVNGKCMFSTWDFMDHFLTSMDGEDQFEVLWGKETETKKMFDV